jgi:predicted ATPase
MSNDRVTEIRVEGLRCLERVRLRLDGLTVLIGDNGTGKSALVEACEILRRVSRASNFLADLSTIHQGLGSLLRYGAGELRLGTTITGPDGMLEYDLELAFEGDHPVISSERLAAGPSGKLTTLLERTRTSLSFVSPTKEGLERGKSVQSDRLAVNEFGTIAAPHPAFLRLQEAMGEPSESENLAASRRRISTASRTARDAR